MVCLIWNVIHWQIKLFIARRIKSFWKDGDVTIYQLNKSTIEFYLPYEDVQNALKESAQNPFIRTKDEWVVGNNECKLNKAQKRMLKDKEIYNHFNLENIPSSIKTELNKIVYDIDD